MFTDLGLGLLGLVAGSGSNKFEGWGRMFGVLAARTVGGDGWVPIATEIFILENESAKDYGSSKRNRAKFAY